MTKSCNAGLLGIVHLLAQDAASRPQLVGRQESKPHGPGAVHGGKLNIQHGGAALLLGLNHPHRDHAAVLGELWSLRTTACGL